MSGCGCSGDMKFEGLSQGYKRVLWAVIFINATMFIVEMVAGLTAQSKALEADALDFLGDSLTYAISLWAIGKSAQIRSNSALFKGATLAVMGIWVLGSTLYRVFYLGQPDEIIMGSVALAALAANLISVVLLMKYRNGDANVRSVWLCSRNDAIGNIAVLIAAGLVFYTATPWPDLVVAFIMATLFCWSSFQIIKQALAEKQATLSSS